MSGVGIEGWTEMSYRSCRASARTGDVIHKRCRRRANEIVEIE